MQENETTPSEKKQKKVIFKTYMVVWYILGVIEILLGFRFVLKLLGANTASGFTAFIYSISQPFMIPFQGIFRTPSESGYVMDTATLVAMAVYLVITYLIAEFLRVAKPVSPAEADQEMNK